MKLLTLTLLACLAASPLQSFADDRPPGANSERPYSGNTERSADTYAPPPTGLTLPCYTVCGTKSPSTEPPYVQPDYDCANLDFFSGCPREGYVPEPAWPDEEAALEEQTAIYNETIDAALDLINHPAPTFDFVIEDGSHEE